MLKLSGLELLGTLGKSFDTYGLGSWNHEIPQIQPSQAGDTPNLFSDWTTDISGNYSPISGPYARCQVQLTHDFSFVLTHKDTGFWNIQRRTLMAILLQRSGLVPVLKRADPHWYFELTHPSTGVKLELWFDFAGPISDELVASGEGLINDEIATNQIIDILIPSTHMSSFDSETEFQEAVATQLRVFSRAVPIIATLLYRVAEQPIPPISITVT